MEICSPIRTDYYVYALGHPAYGLFYIGKGCGSRVHAHELSAMDEASGASEKTEVLRALAAKGETPIRYLVAADLSEREAFQLESVLIAFSAEIKRTGLTPNLRNLAKGHGSGETMLRDHEIDMMNADPAVLGTRRLLLLSINREFAPFADYAAGLPDHVAGRWVLNLEKARSCEYVLACTRRRIVGVYKPTDWRLTAEVGDKRRRYWFDGEAATDAFAESIRYRPLPEDIRFGSGNPVAYYPR
ncbi:MAG: LEM-3-like GIY-YIG domain-containing protein [Fimbriimonadales bacterium]